MDNCLIDITVEFLAVAFHSILYYTSVYPETIFETKKKYSIVVHQSRHPEVNQYIELSLKAIAECLRNGQLKRIEFAVTDSKYEPELKFVFDFDCGNKFDETTDAYLVQTEQNLRAFYLQLVAFSHKFDNFAEDRSFTIFIHTNEATAVSMAANPDLEEFPLVEVGEKFEKSDEILPLRRFSIRNCNIDTYIELKR